MKKLFCTILTLLFLLPGYASHIKGGFITYTYLGAGTGGNNRYQVDVVVYMDQASQNNPQQFHTTIPVTFFNLDNGTQQTLDAPRANWFFLTKVREEDCVTNSPTGIFYLVAIYRIAAIELPSNVRGHTIAYQRCCRITGITNIAGNSGTVGNTYSTTIPGRQLLDAAPQNSSANFLVNDTPVVCRNSYFEYSFRASDANSDSLSYAFCSAWEGGSISNAAPAVSEPPPFISLLYAPGFTGTTPLGNRVTIDPRTGLISGVAPDVGEYVVTVCVTEWRNGIPIAQNRKELHVKVTDCGSVRATLDPTYVNCEDFNVRFQNNSPTGVNTHFWDFGVPGVTNDTANIAMPVFTFPDTGVYNIKLVVNRGDRCADSTRAEVRVYPGFFPGFRHQGVCATRPTQFFDTTRARYGVVNFWSWEFGDPATNADVSSQRNPQYTYPVPGTYPVTFIVASSVGCRDTVRTDVRILDRPPLNLPFRDTLMCTGDSMQLRAEGTGAFSWTPSGQMLFPNTATPIVWPRTTTTYTVQLMESGCVSRDTIRVRVVSEVTLRMRPDTVICLTDTIRLGALTDGLRYLWTGTTPLNDSSLLTPQTVAGPGVNTYTLTSFVGRCFKTASVRVLTVPYPSVSARTDTTICFRGSVTLQGSINPTPGTTYYWLPTSFLTNPNSLNPVARPPDTIAYVLTVRDTLSGCPKPARDTVVVSVTPQIFPWAGRDTMVVAGQPLQLLATGGVRYQWIPATVLSNPNIPNPVGLYEENPEFIHYKVRVFDQYDCVDSARMRVRVFRTLPSIFVPTAFTPNSDGKNDIVRPIAVGIRRIEFFRIFNRWGQLVYETTENGAGWDGRINGKDQGTEVFVWVVQAVDYQGNKYFRKGTVTLIR